MVVLHALAAAGFGPAVEFFAEAVVLRGFGHLSGELLNGSSAGAQASPELQKRVHGQESLCYQTIFNYSWNAIRREGRAHVEHSVELNGAERQRLKAAAGLR
jgi:hypothetical protein